MNEYVFKEEFLEENRPITTVPETNYKSNTKVMNNAVKLIFVQSMLCIFLLIFALIFRFSAPKQYEKFKDGYISASTQADITFEDIKWAFTSVRDFVFSSDKEKGSGGANSALPLNVSTNTYILTSNISSPVQNGVVTSDFGPRVHPIFKTDGFHTGLDIASKLGTPITAAFSGTVHECGTSQAYGNYIIMRHSDTLYTFYGHCDSLKAKEGMNIRRGEVIAYMGSTGYSTGPHLHFEIRIDGKRVDPAYALKGNSSIEF